MENEDKYRALLQSHSNQDHLLALELMQGQLGWSLEKALGVSLVDYIRHFKTVDDFEVITFGDFSLQFQIRYSGHPDNATWKAINHYIIRQESTNKKVFSQEGSPYKTLPIYDVVDLKSFQSAALREFTLLIPPLIKVLNEER